MDKTLQTAEQESILASILVIAVFIGAGMMCALGIGIALNNVLCGLI